MYLLHVSCYENHYKYNSKWNNKSFDLFKLQGLYTDWWNLYRDTHLQ